MSRVLRVVLMPDSQADPRDALSEPAENALNIAPPVQDRHDLQWSGFWPVHNQVGIHRIEPHVLIGQVRATVTRAGKCRKARDSFQNGRFDAVCRSDTRHLSEMPPDVKQVLNGLGR